MAQTAKFIDQASETALSTLAGSKIQTLTSKYCEMDVGRSNFEVHSARIQIAKARCIVIESNWDETSNDRVEYHWIAARLCDRPSDNEDERCTALDQVCLRLGAESRVATISILQRSESGGIDGVICDVGLLIRRRDGLELAIVCTGWIIGGLMIAHTAEGIEEAIRGLTIRAAIQQF